MSSYTVNILLSFSILVPCLIGLVRSGEMLRTYRPVLILFITGTVNEILSFVFAYYYHNNAVNNNIYILIEFLLVAWQFHNWGILKGRKKTLMMIAAAAVVVWIADNVILHPITQFNSVYRIFYSSIIIFFSIEQMNRLIVHEKMNLFKNSIFLFCIAILIFYTYKVLVETFYLLNLPVGSGFYHNLFFILAFVNVFVNLLYGLAVLWIPTKQKFTLPF